MSMVAVPLRVKSVLSGVDWVRSGVTVTICGGGGGGARPADVPPSPQSITTLKADDGSYGLVSNHPTQPWNGIVWVYGSYGLTARNDITVGSIGASATETVLASLARLPHLSATVTPT